MNFDRSTDLTVLYGLYSMIQISLRNWSKAARKRDGWRKSKNWRGWTIKENWTIKDWKRKTGTTTKRIFGRKGTWSGTNETKIGTIFVAFFWFHLTSNDPKIRLLDEKNKIEQDRAEQEKLMADKEAELRLHEAKIAQVGKHSLSIFKAFKISKVRYFLWIYIFHIDVC